MQPSTAGTWRTHAACVGLTALFFPGRSDPDGGADQAKAICADCPVSVPCLEDALSITPAPSGVWGGTSERTRVTLRQRRRAERRTSSTSAA